MLKPSITSLQLLVFTLMAATAMDTEESHPSQKPRGARMLEKRRTVYGQINQLSILKPESSSASNLTTNTVSIHEPGGKLTSSTHVSSAPENVSQAKPRVHFKLSENQIHFFDKKCPITEEKKPNHLEFKVEPPLLTRSSLRRGLSWGSVYLARTNGLHDILSVIDCRTTLDGKASLKALLKDKTTSLISICFEGEESNNGQSTQFIYSVVNKDNEQQRYKVAIDLKANDILNVRIPNFDQIIIEMIKSKYSPFNSTGLSDLVLKEQAKAYGVFTHPAFKKLAFDLKFVLKASELTDNEHSADLAYLSEMAGDVQVYIIDYKIDNKIYKGRMTATKKLM